METELMLEQAAQTNMNRQKALAQALRAQAAQSAQAMPQQPPMQPQQPPMGRPPVPGLPPQGVM